MLGRFMLKFRLGRVKIGVSIWFVSFFAIIFFVADNSALLYGLLAMACHELGHLIVMMLCRCPIKRVSLLLGRLVIEPARRLRGKAEFPVLLGGVAANLLCALLFALDGNMLACAVNLLIAAYNALPAHGLDGGGILQIALCRRMMPSKAYKWQVAISFVLSFLLLAGGFLLLFRGYQNPTMLFAGIYIAAQNINSMRYTS